MSYSELVAVSSRSFSKSPSLRQQLQKFFCHVQFNEAGLKLEGDKLIQFLSKAKYAIIGLEIIDECLLQKLPDLRGICKMGTGIDKVDLGALKRRNILFSSTPGLNQRSVSELVLGLIFNLLRHLFVVNRGVRNSEWQQPVGQLLTNKTVGIIGFGAIGQDLALLLGVFGCKCLVFDELRQHSLAPHVVQVDLKTLLVKSDIISLHIPLSPQNYHFIGIKELSMIQKHAILINTARGGLVDEEALFDVLTKGNLAAAAFDVFEHEPNISKKLLSLDNFFATSHIGGSTYEAIESMGQMAIQHLIKMNE